MKTKLFFFAMFVNVVTSAQVTHVEPTGANYMDKTVSFRVWWNAGSRDTTHLSKVWVWVDYITVNSNNTTSGNSWTRALVSGTPTTTAGTVAPETGNDKGFWLTGNASTNYSATVTVKLDVIASKFDWCAYASDYPPNVTATNGTYTFKGTPPFTLIASNGATQTVSGTTLTASALTVTPASIRDKTECPGVFCIYSGSDLYIDADHFCQQRASDAQNWEAWIKDTRDNQIYRIVQMQTNTWWMAQDLVWDGKPEPTATSYTVRGTARSCDSKAGCGRSYPPTANGSGAFGSDNDARRASDVCPDGWSLPSCTEANDVSLRSNVAVTEPGGTDVYGLSLYYCSGPNWSCGTEHTAIAASSGSPLICDPNRAGGVRGYCPAYAVGVSGFACVRCVRD